MSEFFLQISFLPLVSVVMRVCPCCAHVRTCANQPCLSSGQCRLEEAFCGSLPERKDHGRIGRQPLDGADGAGPVSLGKKLRRYGSHPVSIWVSGAKTE